MKSSIGGDNPDDQLDADKDGIPDRAERDFAADGQAATPTPAAGTQAVHQPDPSPDADDGNEADVDGADDGGLESSRPPGGRVRPPEPN